MYNSLVLQHFNYGLCSWGFHSDDLLFVRVVANHPYKAYTDAIFNKNKFLKIHDFYKLQIYNLFYHSWNNLSPIYIFFFNFLCLRQTTYCLRIVIKIAIKIASSVQSIK